MSNPAPTDLRVNGDRLWARIDAMAQIGGLASGGCNRQALTDEDKAGRHLFIQWCQENGCAISVDRIGNIFARRAGLDPDLPPVLVGSHLDTQPTGGRFDGVYGVLAGLEVVSTLVDGGVVTDRPLDIVVWTNEEGSRFSPALLGSGVYAGIFRLVDALSITDKNGESVGRALDRIGFAGERPCMPAPIHAAFELHIEQGPILEAHGKSIGIVTGVQGIRWYDVCLRGTPAHAGPTPMDRRRDVMRALPEILDRTYALAASNGEWARATFGDINLAPGSRNTVPAELVLAVDLRHPEESTLEQMDADFRALVGEAAGAAQVESRIAEIWRSPATRFDEKCIDTVSRASAALGYEAMEIVSGAGHDSVYLSKVASASMIFIPCAGGVSHNPTEWADQGQVEAGANVLLHAVLDAARRSSERL